MAPTSMFRLFSLFDTTGNKSMTFNIVNKSPMIYIFKQQQNEKSVILLKFFFPDVVRLKIADYLKMIKNAPPKTYIHMTVIQMYPDGDIDTTPNKKVKITIGKDENHVGFIGMTYVGTDSQNHKDKFELISKVDFTIENDPDFKNDDESKGKIVIDNFIEFLTLKFPVAYMYNSEKVETIMNGNNKNNKSTSAPPVTDDIPF